MPRTSVKKKLGPNYTPGDLVCESRARHWKWKLHIEANRGKRWYPQKCGRKTPMDKLGAGWPIDPSPANELDVVNCIKERARMGYPCDTRDVITVVAEFVKADTTVPLSKDGAPVEDWYYGFLQFTPSSQFVNYETAAVLEISIGNVKKPTIPN